MDNFFSKMLESESDSSIWSEEYSDYKMKMLCQIYGQTVSMPVDTKYYFSSFSFGSYTVII